MCTKEPRKKMKNAEEEEKEEWMNLQAGRQASDET